MSIQGAKLQHFAIIFAEVVPIFLFTSPISLFPFVTKTMLEPPSRMFHALHQSSRCTFHAFTAFQIADFKRYDVKDMGFTMTARVVGMQRPVS